MHVMLDSTDQSRLARSFEDLRSKLLDLTLRNPMLSYRPQSRSRKQLQIIDDCPEDVFRRLGSEDFALDLIALPEPADIPADEETQEFISHLSYLKSNDVEYLARLIRQRAPERLASVGENADGAKDSVAKPPLSP